MTVNSINTNIAAYFAQANIGIASNAASSSVARLSSGNRIVKSSDDVAALSTGTSLRINVSTLRVALVNAAQGTSLVQVADGALSQITDILARQKAIALQAGSGSLADTDRVYLNQEFQALSAEINRLTTGTNFNGVNLIDGSLSGSNPLRSGDNTTTATITGFSAQALITAVSFADNAGGTVGDTTFYGALSQGVFEVQNQAAPDFTVSYTINGSTYIGIVIDSDITGGSLVLSNGEGSITFTIAADVDIVGGFTEDAAGAAAFQTSLTTSFASATAFANRTLRTTDATSGATTIIGSGITTADTNGTLLEGTDGADIIVKSRYWDGVNAPTISDFTVVGTSGIGTKFSVTINGRTYTTQAIEDATDLAAATIVTGLNNGELKFYLDGDATANPNEFIIVDLDDSVQIIDVDTAENVAAFVNDLNSIFGRSGGGLSFQIGTSTTDTLSVSIGAANTTTLFAGASLDVLTQLNAATASTALTTALATVTGLRAGVGALQSRFNFASNAIQVSLQNQDAARGELLDTDIASESTNYATAQVKLQAGISVLAQANQQLQSLLKLIG